MFEYKNEQYAELALKHMVIGNECLPIKNEIRWVGKIVKISKEDGITYVYVDFGEKYSFLNMYLNDYRNAKINANEVALYINETNEFYRLDGAFEPPF